MSAPKHINCRCHNIEEPQKQELIRLEDIPEAECDCWFCVSGCTRHPCRPTPAEAQALIHAGYGFRLMQEEWQYDKLMDSPFIEKPKNREGSIYLLLPAIRGSEGRVAPWFPVGRCTFLTIDGKCELHSLGLKPIEGRKVICDQKNKGTLQQQQAVHKLVVQTWNNRKAQRMVQDWLTSRDKNHLRRLYKW